MSQKLRSSGWWIIIIVVLIGIISGFLLILKEANNILKLNQEREVPNNSIERTEIFSRYRTAAQEKLSTMTLDEKISQILLVRYPGNLGEQELEKYQFGGYLFFAPDFADKNTVEVQNLMQALQNTAKIPILTAVDEEGGIVVRVSSNAKLAPTAFESPHKVYASGGMDAIREDTIKKSQLLRNLGINLNLAPVVDVPYTIADYMYERSLGQDAETTAEFARTVITASKGTDVSYTLKHFPGYGNNADTHTGTAQDMRSFRQIWQYDLLPFREGIKAGAEAILVSHNIVTSIDAEMPASLSADVHQLLRDKLGFNGVIITDDIAMSAIDGVTQPTLQAVLAGNDLIITTNYVESIAEIKNALADGTLDESLLDAAVTRILTWKHYKGLISE